MDVYDSGPGTASRYIVVDGNRNVFFLSAEPNSPGGVNDYLGHEGDLRGVRRGKRLPWSEVPDPVKEAIEERM